MRGCNSTSPQHLKCLLHVKQSQIFASLHHLLTNDFSICAEKALNNDNKNPFQNSSQKPDHIFSTVL